MTRLPPHGFDPSTGLNDADREAHAMDRVERHADYDFLIDGGHLNVSQMVGMTDEAITTFAAIERYEDRLDGSDDVDDPMEHLS